MVRAMSWDTEQRRCAAWRPWAVVLFLCALFAAPQAWARPVAVAELCHAEAELDETYANLAQQPARWRCDGANYTIDREAVFVRFRLLPPGHADRPAGFVTHAATFDRIDILMVDRDGTIRSKVFSADRVHHMGSGPLLSMPLPPVRDSTVFVVARIVKPWSKTLASDARLDSMPQGSGWSLGQIVAIAGICGMLVVPMLLNGGYWIVLRKSYVIWHTLLIFAMLVQAFVGTGFIHIFVELPIFVEGSISIFCYGLMCASALMFAGTFLEAGILNRGVWLGLRITALGVFLSAIVAAMPFDVLRPYATMQIYISVACAITMIVIALGNAFHHRSRMVWFQIVGWLPALAVAIYRIARYVSPDGQPTNSIAAQQLALAVEAIASSIGILSRLLSLRRERDSATALALELEGVAGRDALTGLWNRRSIEQAFRELFAQGFRTMAVLDLDHFKLVNDRHGHATGDTVLKIAATALAGDGDTRAVRMGGEEFLLLLRGPDAADRAERRRRAISTRIAGDLPGLDRVVTASMGVVEHDTRGDLTASFDTLYAHCDRLLYEAKRLGRNRAMREKLTSFSARDAQLPLALHS